MSDWTIEARTLPVLGVGGHDFWNNMNTSIKRVVCLIFFFLMASLTYGNQAIVDTAPTIAITDSTTKKDIPAEIDQFLVYPWELKQVPMFAKAWRNATRSSKVPIWVRQLEMAATKGQPIRTDDGWAILYSGNQIHQGGASEISFVYLPSVHLVCGLLQSPSQIVRFGNNGACKRQFAKMLQPSKEN